MKLVCRLTGRRSVKRTRSRRQIGVPGLDLQHRRDILDCAHLRHASTRPPGSSGGPMTRKRLYEPTTPLSSLGLLTNVPRPRCRSM